MNSCFKIFYSFLSIFSCPHFSLFHHISLVLLSYFHHFYIFCALISNCFLLSNKTLKRLKTLHFVCQFVFSLIIEDKTKITDFKHDFIISSVLLTFSFPAEVQTAEWLQTNWKVPPLSGSAANQSWEFWIVSGAANQISWPSLNPHRCFQLLSD